MPKSIKAGGPPPDKPSTKVPPGDITVLLRQWSLGNAGALDEMTPLVYAELRRMAQRHLRGERSDLSLRSCDLVHEAYLRLVDQKNARWHDRAHFFAISARIMRRILVDRARAHQRQKRGGGVHTLVLTEDLDIPDSRHLEMIAVDAALDSLEKLDLQQSRVVEMRFFAGLSIEETAVALGVSKATVNRDWVTARAWMIRELSHR